MLQGIFLMKGKGPLTGFDGLMCEGEGWVLLGL